MVVCVLCHPYASISLLDKCFRSTATMDPKKMSRERRTALAKLQDVLVWLVDMLSGWVRGLGQVAIGQNKTAFVIYQMCMCAWGMLGYI